MRTTDIPAREADVRGVILAGGLATRMGGVDKGLQLHRDRPLVVHAIERLRPQVRSLGINANRNLQAYAAFGYTVWQDDVQGHAGPLAGMLSALQRCEGRLLACVPCDSPMLPTDLVARLRAGLQAQDAEIAIAVTVDADGHRCLHAVCCLLQVHLAQSLADFLRSGRRKVREWMSEHRCVQVVFDEAHAFSNLNTLAELQPASLAM